LIAIDARRTDVSGDEDSFNEYRKSAGLDHSLIRF
jgi:hypothetical protein